VKYVYQFNEGSKELKDLLGGKGANLAEMTKIGLPVPQGFTITTQACNDYHQVNRGLTGDMLEQILSGIDNFEELTGKKFGDNMNPLFVSVRSGAAISMPGMMDTILNLGLNDETVDALARKTNSAQFAYASYARFIEMYANVVCKVPKYLFDVILRRYAKDYNEITLEQLLDLISDYKLLFIEETGLVFPRDPLEQCKNAIKAVFDSWNNERAVIYRRLNDIPNDLGTAVTVQEMVFGNLGKTSGTGVLFTRNPATGENDIYGEYLIDAQGEDVVAGIRTPNEISTLKDVMPTIFDELIKTAKMLENYYRDIQDIEFTIEDKKLFLLQTRNGKRTPFVGVKIAVDMVEEGLITEEEAIMRIKPESLNQILFPTFTKETLKNAKRIGLGLPASPGCVSGQICLNPKEINKYEESILVTLETTPEDIEAMHCSSGILTCRGGMTSHAAVVARGMGKSCITGSHDVEIDLSAQKVRIGSIEFNEGDSISIDGSTGKIYQGVVKASSSGFSTEFTKFMDMVDKHRTTEVRTNVDSAKDLEKAIMLGAQGIGLCRTEHMFFMEERINHIREMIISSSTKERKIALDKLKNYQKSDFIDIFKTLDGRPLNVRLLDAPLHEFLPREELEKQKVASSLNVSINIIEKRIQELHEFNPMLGHRGCRLAITYPEIYKMQANAIIEAAIEVQKQGIDVNLEVMLPLIIDLKEFQVLKVDLEKIFFTKIEESGIKIDYKFGTMIEMVRGCLLADEIATEADYFSFGTNDLTQVTFGFSRDDSVKYTDEYLKKGILEYDPFKSIDRKGVGALIETACQLGRETKPELKIGICGEHGGDPKSIKLFSELGFDYVSCSPFRIPTARLTLAQLELEK